MIHNFHTGNFFEEYGEEEYNTCDEIGVEYISILLEEDDKEYTPAVVVSAIDAMGEVSHIIFTLDVLREAIITLNDAEEALMEMLDEEFEE